MPPNAIPLEVVALMFLRLLIATVLGALLGYERERAGKPAGVRTHGMVCLVAVVSLRCFGGVGDPGRVAAQVVTGIGFLGAGAIINPQGSVHSLTTAAILWVTEAIGLAVGVGMLLMSVMNELLVFLLLRFGPRSGWKFTRSEQE